MDCVLADVSHCGHVSATIRVARHAQTRRRMKYGLVEMEENRRMQTVELEIYSPEPGDEDEHLIPLIDRAIEESDEISNVLQRHGVSFAVIWYL